MNRNKMLNIRSERILDDPKSYWNKIRNRRCIIPVSLTYEHRAIVGWKKKVPYAVRPKEQVIRNMVRDFVTRVFDGSAEPLLVHLVKDRHLSEKEVREITRMIQENK